jgi:hypothetical protein
MQQVLNSKERNEAFLKFLLFFLVTVILIVLAVFFNYRLPRSENKVLQEEVNIQRQQETVQAKFVTKMTEAIALLDSMDKGTTNVEQINSQLTGKLTEMELLRQKDDPSSYGRMHNAILNKLFDLQQSKASVRDLRKKADLYNSSQEELNTVKSQLAAANNELDAIRRGGH